MKSGIELTSFSTSHQTGLLGMAGAVVLPSEGGS
jgi:hypothetical protein